MNFSKGVNDIVNYTNKNLYWTNILLIPSILVGYYIIHDIYSWDEINQEDKNIYLYSWIFVTLYMFIVLIFSTLYHYTYFGEKWLNSILKKIGKIDKITAPIFCIILLVLNGAYIYFINSNCPHDFIFPKIKLLYIISFFFSLLGLSSWIIKRIFYKGYSRQSIFHKIKWIQTHSFFHYTTYTGVLLFVCLYYLENKDIFNYLFLNQGKC